MPTNLSPLWTGAFNTAEKELLSKKVLNYINQTGVDLFPGGVPNTLLQSGGIFKTFFIELLTTQFRFFFSILWEILNSFILLNNRIVSHRAKYRIVSNRFEFKPNLRFFL